MSRICVSSMPPQPPRASTSTALRRAIGRGGFFLPGLWCNRRLRLGGGPRRLAQSCRPRRRQPRLPRRLAGHGPGCIVLRRTRRAFNCGGRRVSFIRSKPSGDFPLFLLAGFSPCIRWQSAPSKPSRSPGCCVPWRRSSRCQRHIIWAAGRYHGTRFSSASAAHLPSPRCTAAVRLLRFAFKTR